jgi:transposase
MSDDALFDVTPPTDDHVEVTDDRVRRYETVNREQIELVPTDLEGLLPPGHAARLVWRFVDGLDLSAFYAPIKAYEGGVGRTPIDPKILIALWLYATIDGVGSARELDRLCDRHDAYRWIRGGVSVNHHTLSDFRVAHQAALDALLTQSIAVLLRKTKITLARVAQDGTRVRAHASFKSFRRRPTLEEALRVARQQVERTKRQPEEASTRQAAAEARAAREALEHIEAALAEIPAVEAAKARKKSKTAARASTTDPEARIMRFADGGFRPGYNVQFATDMDGRAIVGVAVTNIGSDQGQLPPMLDQIEQRTGRRPDAMVADGGFVTKDTVTITDQRGTTLYAPVMQPKSTRAPSQPCEGDAPAVAAWRNRMATDEAKAVYKQRSPVAEGTNAEACVHRALGRVMLRGLGKVHTCALWVALAINVLRVMEIVPHEMT